jgi:hypothetical protein
VILALVQSWGFAIFTESLQGAVLYPGFWFKVQMALFLTTGRGVHRRTPSLG